MSQDRPCHVNTEASSLLHNTLPHTLDCTVPFVKLSSLLSGTLETTVTLELANSNTGNPCVTLEIAARGNGDWDIGDRHL